MYKQKLSDCELDVMQILWDIGPEMNQPEIKEELERRKSRVYGRTDVYKRQNMRRRSTTQPAPAAATVWPEV